MAPRGTGSRDRAVPLARIYFSTLGTAACAPLPCPLFDDEDETMTEMKIRTSVEINAAAADAWTLFG